MLKQTHVLQVVKETKAKLSNIWLGCNRKKKKCKHITSHAVIGRNHLACVTSAVTSAGLRAAVTGEKKMVLIKE